MPSPDAPSSCPRSCARPVGCFPLQGNKDDTQGQNKSSPTASEDNDVRGASRFVRAVDFAIPPDMLYTMQVMRVHWSCCYPDLQQVPHVMPWMACPGVDGVADAEVDYAGGNS